MKRSVFFLYVTAICFHNYLAPLNTTQWWFRGQKMAPDWLWGGLVHLNLSCEVCLPCEACLTLWGVPGHWGWGVSAQLPGPHHWSSSLHWTKLRCKTRHCTVHINALYFTSLYKISLHFPVQQCTVEYTRVSKEEIGLGTGEGGGRVSPFDVWYRNSHILCPDWIIKYFCFMSNISEKLSLKAQSVNGYFNRKICWNSIVGVLSHVKLIWTSSWLRYSVFSKIILGMIFCLSRITRQPKNSILPQIASFGYKATKIHVSCIGNLGYLEN